MDADAKRPGGGTRSRARGLGLMRTPADTCGQGGEGVKNWQNLADVFYGWPLMKKNATVSIIFFIS